MRIDLTEAIKTTQELLDELNQLHGTEVDEAPTRAGQRQRTQLTRRLLFLAHLGDRARVQVMDAYHGFKDRDDPTGGAHREQRH